MLVNDPVTQARLDLTTALRAAARHGLNEGVCNHFSMAVPGRDELFLVNPQGLHWSEITPADLVIADGEGNIIEGKYPVEATAFFIHARIHQGNERAPGRAAHPHALRHGADLDPATGGSRCAPRTPSATGTASPTTRSMPAWRFSNDEGDRMCRALGDKDILFLRNHGVIVTGPTVAQAYDDLYYLERTAMVQVLAMQTGRPLHNIDEALAEHTARQIAGDASRRSCISNR